MEGNTNPWWERSGLTPPEEGGREQEAADPAEPAVEEGEKGQEVADPAESETEASELDTEETDEGEGNPRESPEPGDEKKGRNAQEAAQRRERKRLAEEQKVREAAQREQAIRTEEATKAAENLKKIFSSLGLRDAAGKPVETAEDYERYEAERKTARLRRELKAGELSPESLEAALLQSPRIQGVLQQAEASTNAAKQREQAAAAAQFKANMERELNEIRKLNPQIRSTDDIIRMETGPEYARFLRLGLKPSEAYKMANFETIRNGDKMAAEQAARNGEASKRHLRGVPSAAGEPFAVPSDYARNMRRFVPGISDKEIEKFYKESKKK